jgi:hypothetical protein
VVLLLKKCVKQKSYAVGWDTLENAKWSDTKSVLY